jgi:hypothetical protein
MVLVDPCSPCIVPDLVYKWLMLESTTENIVLQFLHGSLEIVCSRKCNCIRNQLPIAMFAFITYVLYHAVHMQHHYLRNLGVLRHITRCDLELLKWQIAWLLHWECSGLAHMSFKEILLTIESEIFQANLMGLCYWVDGVTTSSLFSARFRPTKSYFLHEDMQLNNNKAPFQNLILAFHEVPDEVGVELCNQLGTTIKHIWSSQFLEYLTGSEHGSTFQEPSLALLTVSLHTKYIQLFWDPSIWGILGFGDRDCAQVETTCGRNGTSALPYVDQAGVNNVYYLDMPYYFERVYADQDCYIILSEVQTENGYISTQLLLCPSLRHYTSKLTDSHVPWDPGGSTWYRLEVKPKFKGEGLSATSVAPLLGWPRCYSSWACPARRHQQQLFMRRRRTEAGRLGTERTGRRLRPRPGLACVCCLSLSSSLDSPLSLQFKIVRAYPMHCPRGSVSHL